VSAAPWWSGCTAEALAEALAEAAGQEAAHGNAPTPDTLAHVEAVAKLANRTLVKFHWGTNPETGELYR
jgi:hypothetical protein